MIDAISHHLSSIFGLCKKTKAPGTVASFVSLLFSFLIYYFFDKTVYIAILVILFIVGFWAINKIHKENGLGDYQWVGIDEMAGMWLANLFLLEFDFTLFQVITFSTISFVIFRVIDIFKFIPPLAFINKSEKQTALMVMLDDIVGGIYTYFAMMIVLGLLGFYSWNFFYFTLLILLPAMIANMTPVLLKMKYWNTPINENLFGKNKTWRGFLSAIVIGTLSYVLLVNLGTMSRFDLDIATGPVEIVVIGFFFSFGAIGGDLVKSFFKRKQGIDPGESFPPWDQIDYVLGAIVLTYFIYHYTFSQVILMLVLGGTISALSHRIGYVFKMNNTKQ